FITRFSSTLRYRTPLYLLFSFTFTTITVLSTFSLHDALPIFRSGGGDRHLLGAHHGHLRAEGFEAGLEDLSDLQDPPRSPRRAGDRKSTPLNSSHVANSYAGLSL